MKRVTRCAGCEKLVALYQTYSVQVEDTTFLPGAPRSMGQPDVYKSKLCDPCAANAGYKTKKTKALAKQKAEDKRAQTQFDLGEK